MQGTCTNKLCLLVWEKVIWKIMATLNKYQTRGQIWKNRHIKKYFKTMFEMLIYKMLIFLEGWKNDQIYIICVQVRQFMFCVSTKYKMIPVSLLLLKL